jgi:hypothetical protein
MASMDEPGAGDDVSPLVPGKVYYVLTPYDLFGASRALMDALEAAERGQPEDSTAAEHLET